ncbi:MAG: indolepyruvate oxidoreductase subunit beta family protein [Luminiphilus sp.]|nr:indolepyruvate oxidoreductase subunit beta family protein [Luminiphilus sp.]MDG1461423.1 indolepyruvate oxidoreductase subunit beta family protein [Luminiphilus sp.]MDG2441955.1 indolepyruvate oxidoreductase subunit beta family protein [Luminiphilus sp.]
MIAPLKTINMIVAALGGEGGGVLTNWLIEVAKRSGWYCQSTSLAGVAQRTGATIYYLEFIPRSENQPEPVMSLFPAQGDIDIAVTSEIAEAGRMISRGFVSPERTTLISSDHRVYGITEKSDTTDGTADTAFILDLSKRYANRLVHFDLLELVQRHGTVISAGLFGAIAGAGVLPFQRDVFTEVLAAGKGAAANRAAFDESFDRAQSGGVALYDPDPPFVFGLPEATTPLGARLLPLIAALPGEVHEVAYQGVLRLLDYQDEAYAADFLQRVAQVVAIDAEHNGYDLTREAARWLALWMAFEDIPRVAQLKCRPARETEIREEVRAASGQFIQVTEFFHPRVEEVAALLPKAWGQRLLNSNLLTKVLGSMLGARKLRTDKVLTQWALRRLAALKGGRRKTLGFSQEWAMIERWFSAVLSAPSTDVAKAIADCGGMVKGYGATRHRTTSRLIVILDTIKKQDVVTADFIRRAQTAAMLGEDSAAFDDVIQSESLLMEHAVQ